MVAEFIELTPIKFVPTPAFNDYGEVGRCDKPIIVRTKDIKQVGKEIKYIRNYNGQLDYALYTYVEFEDGKKMFVDRKYYNLAQELGISSPGYAEDYDEDEEHKIKTRRF